MPAESAGETAGIAGLATGSTNPAYSKFAELKKKPTYAPVEWAPALNAES